MEDNQRINISGSWFQFSDPKSIPRPNSPSFSQNVKHFEDFGPIFTRAGCAQQSEAGPFCDTMNDSSKYRVELIAPVCVRLTQGDPSEGANKESESPADSQYGGTNYSYYRYPATVDFSTIDQIEAQRDQESSMEDMQDRDLELDNDEAPRAENALDPSLELHQDKPEMTPNNDREEQEYRTEHNISCFNSASCEIDSSEFYQCNNSGNSRSIPECDAINRQTISTFHPPAQVRRRTYEMSSRSKASLCRKLNNRPDDEKKDNSNKESRDEQKENGKCDNDYVSKLSDPIPETKHEYRTRTNSPVTCQNTLISAPENSYPDSLCRRKMSNSKPTTTKRKKRSRDIICRSAPACVIQASKRPSTGIHKAESKKAIKHCMLHPMPVPKKRQQLLRKPSIGWQADQCLNFPEKCKLYHVDLCTSSPTDFQKGKEQDHLHTIISLPSVKPPRVMMTFIAHVPCGIKVTDIPALRHHTSSFNKSCPEMCLAIKGVSEAQTSPKLGHTSCSISQTPFNFRKASLHAGKEFSNMTSNVSKKCKSGIAKSKMSLSHLKEKLNNCPRSPGMELRTSLSLTDEKPKLCIPEHTIIYMDKHDTAAPQFWEELNSKLNSSNAGLQKQNFVKSKGKIKKR